jgi:hypothetical protein
VEASRKHGPFDTRWPCLRKDSSGAMSTAPPLRAEEAAEALDWNAFSNRYFPERRRHESEARSAYLAYSQGREWRTTPARLSLVPGESASPSSGNQKKQEPDAYWPRLRRDMHLKPKSGLPDKAHEGGTHDQRKI